MLDLSEVVGGLEKVARRHAVRMTDRHISRMCFWDCQRSFYLWCAALRGSEAPAGVIRFGHWTLADVFRDHRNGRLLDRAAIEATRSAWRNDARRGGECNPRRRTHSPSDQFQELGEDVVSKIVSSNVGRRVHRLIGELVGEDVVDVTEAVDRLLAAEPVSGAVRASVRLQVSQMVVVYLARFKPLDVELLAVELPLTGCQADVVFRHLRTGGVVIDEIKSSPPTARPTAQICNLVASGQARWGAEFVGVRVCPTLAPSRALLFNGDPPAAAASWPDWVQVR